MDPKTKAKLMEMVSEALDKQAYVSIHFTQFEKANDFKPVFKEDVEEKAKKIADMLSVSVGESVSNSFMIDAGYDCVNLCFSYLPEEKKSEYMEEDVWMDESKLG
ncbi:hypothetical protein ABE28_008795 [Peribacillus muralis]|uniref:Uncharacterized protein n=1 Tax=Peribacillus muralis TaxID=264697 RepID=A0A1B3XMK7_9BACI|nr:hypothetical protein [Peribacillus muralis]AOH54448.1 hypothetical protein ABE28_008795 [Peribacillus muralis]